MKRRLCFLLLLMPLIALSRSNGADPKTEPALLQGYVMDAVTKKPVPGVTVCASTSKGSAPMMEAITDAEGYFHFSQLPSMLINLQFDKKGYQLYKKSGVQVQEKTVTKVNIEFTRQEEQNDEEDDHIILKMLKI